MFKSIGSAFSENVFRAKKILKIDQRTRPGILIQEIIDGKVSGVIFTRHPLKPGLSLVEYVYGECSLVTSGESNPNMVSIDKITNEVVEKRCTDDYPEKIIDKVVKVSNILEVYFDKTAGYRMDI
jgi:phosphoenolpyruvate synthase/pyruvate phosphate dikinase